MRRSRFRALAVAACAGAALSLAACRSADQKFQLHLGRGEDYEKEGRRAEALLEYRNALQAKPDSAEANFRIARLLMADGKEADAVFFFRETERLDPKHTEAAMAEAKLVLFQDPARARELIDQAMERDPKNALVHLRRAELALAQNDSATALASVQQAIALDPKDGIYPYNLGVVYLAKVREERAAGGVPPDAYFQSAVDAFRKSDELYGGNLNARLMMGRSYAAWPGHKAEAIEPLKSAVALAGEKGSLDEKRGAVQAVLDYAVIAEDAELREWALQQLVAFDPGALEAWAELARRADDRGESGDAVYQRLLEQRPKDVGAHVRYAAYLVQMGRADDGLAHLAKTADDGIEPDAALDELVRFQLQLKKIDDAKATVARLEREHPDSMRTQLAKARLALDENRAADAASALRSVVGGAETAEGQRLLATAELALGNTQAATAAIDRALALAPNSSAVLYQKVQVHAAAGDWNAVLQTLNRLESVTGTLPLDMRLMLANAYYGANDPDNGRKTLERMMKSKRTLPYAAVAFAEREGKSHPDLAAKYLEEADRIAPGQPPIIAALAQTDLAMGNAQRALDRLTQALSAKNPPPGLYQLRAQVHVALKQLDLAEKDARLVLELDPSLPGAVQLLVAIYTEQGHLDEAVSALEAAEKAGTLHAGGRALLGRVYLSRGDAARAKPMIEKALAENPNLPDAKNDLAFLLATDRTDLERALTLAQEAQKALPNSVEVADTVGFVYLQKGLTAPAIDQFRYAIELAGAGKAPAATHYHLGLALVADGRKDDAAAEFERALAGGGSSPEAAAAKQELERLRAEGAGSAGTAGSGPS